MQTSQISRLDGTIDENVTHIIKIGWLKCYRNVMRSIHIKVKEFHRNVLRSAMLEWIPDL